MYHYVVPIQPQWCGKPQKTFFQARNYYTFTQPFPQVCLELLSEDVVAMKKNSTTDSLSSHLGTLVNCKPICVMCTSGL